MKDRINKIVGVWLLPSSPCFGYIPRQQVGQWEMDGSLSFLPGGSSLPSMRGLALEDRFHPFANSDDNECDQVLNQLNDPSYWRPELVLWIAHVAGTADEALSFGLLWLM